MLDIKKNNKNINGKKLLYKLIIIILFNLIILTLFVLDKNKKTIKKVGVIGVRHEVNIGNNLIKYAISILLKNLGYEPYIIGTHLKNKNISFINQTTNLVIIQKNFSEIKKDDYDVLMVNSDQTWRKFDKNFYDYGFLKFAEGWKIKKFVYGASIGFNYWQLTSEEDNIARNLLKDFTGISTREKGSMKLIEEHFKIKPEFVLDPTLLINKKYYLDIIKNFKGEINFQKKFIFIYCIERSKYIVETIKKLKSIFNYDIYYLDLNNCSVQKFIYYIIKSVGVITNSFHGIIFSIIFNKPFITIYGKSLPTERFNSLSNIFGIQSRLFQNGQYIDINQLLKPLNINYTLFNQLKLKSINFIKNNLEK